MPETTKVHENVKDFESKSKTKYKFQKVAPIDWLDILDEVEDGAKVGQRKRLYGKVLENVVVQPKLEMKDFEDFAEMDEVVTAAIRFQQGK
jgi:hypothetical protein